MELNSIQEEERLLRWLHPSQFNWEERRPTSAAFTDPYMSIDFASLTTLEESYARGQRYGKNAVVSITVAMATAKEQRVCYCPTRVYRDQHLNFLRIVLMWKSIRPGLTTHKS